jgi:hypothetical protein
VRGTIVYKMGIIMQVILKIITVCIVMPIYNCQKCLKSFTRRSSYDNHLLKRKTPCALIILTSELLTEYLKNIDNFICGLCKKTFTRKYNLKKHIIKFCGVYNPSIFIINKNNGGSPPHDTSKHTQIFSKNNKFTPEIPKETINICNFCDKYFTRKYNLTRHLNGRCSIKKEEEKDIKKIYEVLIQKMDNIENQNEKILNLEKQNKELHESIKIMSRKVNTVNNDICNNNNTINSNNTINIIAFGKEKLDYKEDVVKILLSQGYNAVAKTIEYTNFNKNKPQFHNVYIPNMRSPYAAVYDGIKWKLEDINSVLNQLYDDKRCYLEDKFDEFIDSLDDSTTRKFNRFLNDDKDDNKTVKWIKKNIKLMMYNKRQIPIKTKNYIKLQN